MVVVKTGKLDLKKRECTSGSDCGLYCKINTHLHAYTHTAVNNEAASAGFKEPGLLASVPMGQDSMSGRAGPNCKGIFNGNTQQAAQI